MTWGPVCELCTVPHFQKKTFNLKKKSDEFIFNFVHEEFGIKQFFTVPSAFSSMLIFLSLWSVIKAVACLNMCVEITESLYVLVVKNILVYMP